MLAITDTPYHTGVKISGDYFDLDRLDQALHRVIGNEDKHDNYKEARKRILGISSEIRHAAQGDRNIEMVFNGLQGHVKKQHGFIAPDKNIYFSVEILWPEILFASIALKDFIRIHKKELKNPEWDFHLHTASHFQALVLDCLHGQTQEEEFQAILEAFSNALPVEDYAIQYIDFLNLKYINAAKQQREKMLPAIAEKIAVQDRDYLSFRQQFPAAAPIQADYPENFSW
jgi:hypothetical protein